MKVLVVVITLLTIKFLIMVRANNPIPLSLVPYKDTPSSSQQDTMRFFLRVNMNCFLGLVELCLELPHEYKTCLLDLMINCIG